MKLTTHHQVRSKIVIGAVIAATFIAGISLGNASAKPDFAGTYAACDRAHSVSTQEYRADKEWKICGDLQAKTNTEYVCGNLGTCWLEVK